MSLFQHENIYSFIQKENLPGGLDIVRITRIIAMKLTKLIERPTVVAIIVVGCVFQIEYCLLENAYILTEKVKERFTKVLDASILVSFVDDNSLLSSILLAFSWIFLQSILLQL